MQNIDRRQESCPLDFKSLLCYNKIRILIPCYLWIYRKELRPLRRMDMSEKTKKRLTVIYGSVLSAAILLLGLLLILSCVGIYQSGENPFSRESIGEAFRAILIPVVLTLLLILGGFVLSIVLKPEQPKLQSTASDRESLRRLMNRHSAKESESAASPLHRLTCTIRRHEKRVLLWIRISLLLLGVLSVLLGILNGGAGDVVQKAIKICTECIGLG